MLQWKGPYEVVEVVNRMDYKVKVDDRVGTYHIILLKKFEERDDTVISGMAIIEAEPSSEIGIVDDDSLLNLVCLKGEETYKDVQISENLTAEQQADVTRLLDEFQCIFTDMHGTTHLAEHKIELTTKSPICVRPYPIPYAKRQEVEKEVQAMLEADVIEPAMSDYNSPIVLVKKKDGTNRFCVDFRRINLVTKFDIEPMGNPEDIMSKLKDDKFLSKIDLSKGFWQFLVEKSSQHLTGFSTTDGSYTFKKMLFGLVNSGSTFNRMMRKLLHGCSNADNYVDDILGHTRRWDDHLVTLRDIFTRVRDAGLTLKPSKCLIGFESIAFT